MASDSPSFQPLADIPLRIERWRNGLEELQVALQHDCPPGDPVLLVGQIEDDVVDALASLHRMARRIAEVSERWRSSRFVEAGGLLAGVQGELATLGALYAERLAAPHRLQHVAELGRTRGPAWAGWSRVVLQSLNPWPAAVRGLTEALGTVWLLLVSRSAELRGVPAGAVCADRPATQCN